MPHPQGFGIFDLLIRDQEAGGSNLLAPTTSISPCEFELRDIKLPATRERAAVGRLAEVTSVLHHLLRSPDRESSRNAKLEAVTKAPDTVRGPHALTGCEFVPPPLRTVAAEYF